MFEEAHPRHPLVFVVLLIGRLGRFGGLSVSPRRGNRRRGNGGRGNDRSLSDGITYGWSVLSYRHAWRRPFLAVRWIFIVQRYVRGSRRFGSRLVHSFAGGSANSLRFVRRCHRLF